MGKHRPMIKSNSLVYSILLLYYQQSLENSRASDRLPGKIRLERDVKLLTISNSSVAVLTFSSSAVFFLFRVVTV